MSFSLWSTPFVGFVTVIPAAFLNKIRVDVSRGLDTIGGGDYANASLIRWTAGSAGWEFDAAVKIGSAGVLTVASGGTLVTATGSTTTLHGDATFDGTITGGSGGLLEIDTGCVLDVLSGGEVAVESGGEIVLRSGSTLLAQSGSLINVQSGAVESVAGTVNLASGGLLHALSGSFITATSATVAFSAGTTSLGGATTVPNGATFLVTGAGAQFNVNAADVNISGSAVTISAGTTSLGGATTVPSLATFTCAVGSTATVAGALTCNSTSVVALAGATTLSGLGTFTCASGTTLAHSNGSAETHAFGSQDTYLAGALIANGATTTRTGSETRSGAGAWTTGRVSTGPNANAVIDATQNDGLRCPVLTGTRTWTLDDPGGSVMKGLGIYVERTITAANANDLVIADNVSGGVGSFTGGANGKYGIHFVWDGAHWFAVSAFSYTGPNAYVTLP